MLRFRIGLRLALMRIGAPVLGPAWLIQFRVGIAALFLLICAVWLRKPLKLRQYWRHYLIVGCFNSALPFFLIAFAAKTLTASLLSVLMALTLPFYPASTEPTLGVWTAVAALGVVCTGVAYLIYFRLIQDMGPISALSVTFLIPVFGILWGVLSLDEQIDWSTNVGAVVVLAGTALTNGITPRFFLESGKSCRAQRPEKSQ